MIPCELAPSVDPVYAIFTDTVISDPEVITTAVCWTFRKKLSIVPVRTIELTANQKAQIERVKMLPHANQLLVFLAMSGVMIFGKEICITGTTTNFQYLLKRWQDLCTRTNQENMFTNGSVSKEVCMQFLRKVETWQTWIKIRGELRKKVLETALHDLPDDLPEIVKQAQVQIRMVLQGYGLTSVYFMEAFISSPNTAILIPTVVQQAVEFKKALTELRTRYGDNFKYLKVYPLEGANNLNCRNFPDFYYAAIKTAIANKKLGKRFVITNVQTSVPKYQIDRHIRGEYDDCYNIKLVNKAPKDDLERSPGKEKRRRME